MLDGDTAGDGVVVQKLAERDVDLPLRQAQRVLAPHRQAKRAAELATVRFETMPGEQMQIDLGDNWVGVAGIRTKVYFFVAVLGVRVESSSARP